MSLQFKLLFQGWDFKVLCGDC